MKRLVLRITTHGAPFNIVENGPVVMVFANLDREARIVIVGGLDKTARTSPASLASPDTTVRASTMARMVVAVTRWRIPLVPRETDELPFPTDRKSLWIFIQHGCSAFLAEGASRSEPVLPPLTLHFNVATTKSSGMFRTSTSQSDGE